MVRLSNASQQVGSTDHYSCFRQYLLYKPSRLSILYFFHRITQKTTIEYLIHSTFFLVFTQVFYFLRQALGVMSYSRHPQPIEPTAIYFADCSRGCCRRPHPGDYSSPMSLEAFAHRGHFEHCSGRCRALNAPGQAFRNDLSSYKTSSSGPRPAPALTGQYEHLPVPASTSQSVMQPAAHQRRGSSSGKPISSAKRSRQLTSPMIPVLTLPLVTQPASNKRRASVSSEPESPLKRIRHLPPPTGMNYHDIAMKTILSVNVSKQAIPARYKLDRDIPSHQQCIIPDCVIPTFETRKVISHFFGRNKESTKDMGKDCFVVMCRPHYQRTSYEAKKSDKSSNKWRFPSYETSLIHLVLDRVKVKHPNCTWSIKPCKLITEVFTEQKKVAKAQARGETYSPFKLDKTETKDQARMSFEKYWNVRFPLSYLMQMLENDRNGSWTTEEARSFALEMQRFSENINIRSLPLFEFLFNLKSDGHDASEVDREAAARNPRRDNVEEAAEILQLLSNPRTT